MTSKYSDFTKAFDLTLKTISSLACCPLYASYVDPDLNSIHFLNHDPDPHMIMISLPTDSKYI